MAKIEIDVDSSAFNDLVIEELLWHASVVDKKKEKKLRKALQRTAAYFMTYPEAVEHFGKEKADEYFR